MALGYAEKLSYREDVGKVGMPELFDSRNDLQTKIEELSKLIKGSRHLVAFTGAGISTSCGIPDFRGPKGVWTLQHEGKPLPKADLPFHQARPGITHMALVALQRAGILKFVISQNIDGLHLKSGIPRECLSELHGCSFREVCLSCGKEYLRDFEIETIGLKNTGRRCTDPSCGGKLKDTVLDWEDALPPEELVPAEKHCKDADLVICLGTSLQITPACNLPVKSVRAGGKMVIINLQATPKDKKAALVIRARVDEVILGVMERLCLSIPPFVRIDRVRISWFYSTKSRNRTARWTLRVDSSHGKNCPMPFVESVEVSFPDRTDLKAATLKERPFVLRRTTVKLEDFDVLVKLNFGEGCMHDSVFIRHPLKFKVELENSAPKNITEGLDIIKTNASEPKVEPENSAPNNDREDLNVIKTKASVPKSEPENFVSYDNNEMKTNGLEPKVEPENSVPNDSDDVFDSMKSNSFEALGDIQNEVQDDNKETSYITRNKALELKVERENKIIDAMKTKALETGSIGDVVPLNTNIEDVEGVFATEYAIVTCIIKYGKDAPEPHDTKERESPKRSHEDSQESPLKRSKIDFDKG